MMVTDVTVTDSIRLPSSFGWRLIWAACMQVFMYVILNYAKSTKYWTVISQNIKTWTLDTFNWSQWVCVWVIGYFCSIYVSVWVDFVWHWSYVHWEADLLSVFCEILASFKVQDPFHLTLSRPHLKSMKIKPVLLDHVCKFCSNCVFVLSPPRFLWHVWFLKTLWFLVSV